jgi:hypothetical protein
MATIDLTAPEVDLPKARELLHKALDLLERNDDAAPPSDARTLDVKGCMKNGVLDEAYKSDQFLERLLSENVKKLLNGENVAKLDLVGASRYVTVTVGVLLDPEQFAKIQRVAGDGRVGQAFFKACAAWAWALLKKEHDPTFPDSDDE